MEHESSYTLMYKPDLTAAKKNLLGANLPILPPPPHVFSAIVQLIAAALDICGR